MAKVGGNLTTNCAILHAVARRRILKKIHTYTNLSRVRDIISLSHVTFYHRTLCPIYIYLVNGRFMYVTFVKDLVFLLKN